MSEQRVLRAEQVYGWLLRLYPAAFRHEFGAEMHSVFGEMLRDAAARSGTGGVVLLWRRTLLDLGKSLAHEHWDEWKGMPLMKMQRFASTGTAVLIGLLMVLPFILLEAIMTSGFARYGFPLMLFTFMWFLAALFVLILTPVVRGVRAGSVAVSNPVMLVLKVLLLGLLAWGWISLVIDQMPCFLGVPMCD